MNPKKRAPKQTQRNPVHELGDYRRALQEAFAQHEGMSHRTSLGIEAGFFRPLFAEERGIPALGVSALDSERVFQVGAGEVS